PGPPPSPPLRKQATDRSQPEAMSAQELAGLKDPLFNLLLKDRANLSKATSLAGITQQLQPAQQNVFVVDERIADPAPRLGNSPASRRAVLTFEGQTQGEELRENVALSVFFNAEAFPSITEIEAMAWDDGAGKFNYYKLDRSSGEAQPSWKFRGDSRDADLLSTTARANTCMACHINGGMVMKEFKAPWINWHSSDFDAAYLRGSSRNAWPVAKAANSPLRDLRGAQELEFAVESANARLNQRLIAALARANPGTGANGGRTVTDVKRLLKPLFVSTEFNLMSSFANSPNHPFGPAGAGSGFSSLDIPLSFFLNDTLLARDLNVAAFELFDIGRMSDREYQTLLRRGSTSLNGQFPGDSQFAWLTPEASAIDNTYIRQLIEQEILPRSFVAAVMAVDLENPVFSSDRERLWSAANILPTQFKTGPNGDLTAQTIANLKRLSPTSTSPEGQFLAALQSRDPVQFLQARVDRYVQQEKRRLGDAKVRPEELARLYRKLLERRQQVAANPVQTHLIESPLLFPKASVAALPVQVAEPAPVSRPTLRRGDRGDSVVALQKLLLQAGVLSGPADGDFGPGTERAVVALQRSRGLAADGVAGPATWAALMAPKQRPLLRLGDRGDGVVELQQLLQKLGLLQGLADGDFGPITQRAVIAAQRRFGLEADGVVGPATWAKLVA
ncbi:MAG: peptidoglycan-binding protein, partial [Synechococcales cyanobacterium RM1_1_8]|nr:peptidoglycan-binding protein [Synechococcales cyanobacterium RM1_1_8]